VVVEDCGFVAAVDSVVSVVGSSFWGVIVDKGGNAVADSSGGMLEIEDDEGGSSAIWLEVLCGGVQIHSSGTTSSSAFLNGIILSVIFLV